MFGAEAHLFDLTQLRGSKLLRITTGGKRVLAPHTQFQRELQGLLTAMRFTRLALIFTQCDLADYPRQLLGGKREVAFDLFLLGTTFALGKTRLLQLPGHGLLEGAGLTQGTFMLVEQLHRGIQALALQLRQLRATHLLGLGPEQVFTLGRLQPRQILQIGADPVVTLLNSLVRLGELEQCNLLAMALLLQLLQCAPRVVELLLHTLRACLGREHRIMRALGVQLEHVTALAQGLDLAIALHHAMRAVIRGTVHQCITAQHLTKRVHHHHTRFKLIATRHPGGQVIADEHSIQPGLDDLNPLGVGHRDQINQRT